MKTRLKLTGIGLILLALLGNPYPVASADQQVEEEEDSARNPPQTLGELLNLPDTELGRVDVALMNLLCSQGLPGAEGISVPDTLAVLDQWAKRVQSETDRHLYRFRNNPADFYSSEHYFRALMMAVVMYEDFVVRYNPERMAIPEVPQANDRFFADSRDIFLHGLIGTRRMGTCSSMPVLYVAVGRRLGYPLKLVTTKAHLFFRWEDAKERFDLEATGKGMNRYDDAHFKQWPFPMSDQEIRAEGYLKSLTAPEELAVFLSLRGNCLKEAGRFDEAIVCYAQASRLAPGVGAYRFLVAAAQKPQSGATGRRSVDTNSAAPACLNPASLLINN